MSWILIAVISYFFLAIVNLMDKILIKNVLPSSRAYAFIISIMGGVILVAAPWLLMWPGWWLLFFQLATGLLFPVALILMFSALRHGDASRVTVLIGGIIPIITIGLSYVFLAERFSFEQWLGVLGLLLGTFVIASIKNSQSQTARVSLMNRRVLMYSIGAAVCYALFFIGTKYAYGQHNFWSSFIWIRLGGVLTALLLLVRASDRREIISSLKKQSGPQKRTNQLVIIGNQTLGAVSFILQNYAISFGSVALINALQGVQYVFVLLFGALLTVFRPKILRENVKRRVVVQKILAIILISLGLYFIVR